MGSKEKTEFAQRMKEYEEISEVYLDKEKYTIVRVDGHKFSKWTKGFEKPFDDFLTNALAETSRALMEEFKSVCAYSQSDEITLIFKPDINLIYAGRVQKLTSLIASFASMYFNDLVRQELITNLKTSMLSGEMNPRSELLKTKIGKAYFDARVFQVDSKTEAFNTLLWRMKDCKRNSKNVLAHNILGHKKCMNKDSNELVEICESLGHKWDNLPEQYKYGVLWKKESYTKEVEFTEDGRNYISGFCIRTKFVSFSTEFKYSEDNVNMVVCDKITN